MRVKLPLPFCYRGYSLLPWEVNLLKECKAKGLIPKQAHFGKYAIDQLRVANFRVYKETKPGREVAILVVAEKSDGTLATAWPTEAHPLYQGTEVFYY